MRHSSERLSYLHDYANNYDVLHIGAGRGGFGTTLDLSPLVQPDIVADLTRQLPIEDNSYDAVYAFSILEHIPDLVSLMGELHRIIRPGGFLAVLGPHFSSASVYIDPTHVRGFSARTFDYFVEGSALQTEFGWYSDARFTIKISLLTLESRIMNRLAGGLVNRHTDLYETHLAYIIRGAGLYWELQIVK